MTKISYIFVELCTYKILKKVHHFLQGNDVFHLFACSVN